MLLRKIMTDMPETERARWAVVRLDKYETLPGLVLAADVDAGTATMRTRGPDEVAQDGTRTPTFKDVGYALGAGSIAIVGR